VVNVRKAEEEAQSALDPEAFIRTMGNPASKVCPNPRCGRVFVRIADGHFVEAQSLREFFVGDVAPLGQCTDVEVEFWGVKCEVVNAYRHALVGGW
jgi:hypothetical protein